MDSSLRWNDGYLVSSLRWNDGSLVSSLRWNDGLPKKNAIANPASWGDKWRLN